MISFLHRPLRVVVAFFPCTVLCCAVLCCADLHCIALSYYTHSGSKRVTSVQSRVLEAEAEAEEEEEGRAG